MPLGYVICTIILNYHYQLWTLPVSVTFKEYGAPSTPMDGKGLNWARPSFQIHSNVWRTFPRITFVAIGSWESNVQQDTIFALFVLQWTQQCRAHTHFLTWASHRRRHPRWNESRQNIRHCSMASSASTLTWLTARPRIPPLQQVMSFACCFQS
jgi:hypothetical protein